MNSFWSMGGYGLYVWSAYVLTGLVLGANALLPYRRYRQLRRALNNPTPGADDDA